MLTISNVQGVIFDVDETLHDPGLEDPANALHEQARLQALYEAGRRHNLPQLLTITPQQNLAGFLESPVHSLEGAVWTLLYRAGIVTSEAPDTADPLLQEISTRKNDLYKVLMRAQGKPVKGAVEFVKWMADQGLKNHMAIASTAGREELDIFLEEITDLKQFFPESRIMAKDNVIHLKPHPEAFDKAFLSLGLPESARRKVLAFEDNPRGVMSAKAAGLFTCAITTVYSREALANQPVAPDLIADSFAEFKKLLGSRRSV